MVRPPVRAGNRPCVSQDLFRTTGLVGCNDCSLYAHQSPDSWLHRVWAIGRVFRTRDWCRCWRIPSIGAVGPIFFEVCPVVSVQRWPLSFLCCPCVGAVLRCPLAALAYSCSQHQQRCGAFTSRPVWVKTSHCSQRGSVSTRRQVRFDMIPTLSSCTVSLDPGHLPHPPPPQMPPLHNASNGMCHQSRFTRLFSCPAIPCLSPHRTLTGRSTRALRKCVHFPPWALFSCAACTQRPIVLTVPSVATR